MIDKPDPSVRPKGAQILWALMHLAVVLGLVLLVKLGFDWLSARIHLLEADTASQAMTGLIVTLLIGYAILIAIPFVPGVEIGAALLMIQGAEAAPLVYLATLLGMTLAFLVGQYLSLDWMSARCDNLRLFRLCMLVQKIQQTRREERLIAIQNRLPKWLSPLMVQYRYLTVGAVINLPGSIAIGGGGGIMLAAGLSRLFHTGWMIVTIALATLPIPLAVWIMGTDIMW